MNRFLSRKFIVSILVIASADMLVAVGSINATIWGSTVGAVVMLYVAGNVTQTLGSKSPAQ